MEVLKELGADEKRILTVFNKIDICEDEFALQRLQAQFPEAEFVSVLEQDGIEKLIHRMDELLETDSTYGEYLFPFDRYDLISQLHQAGCVKDERTKDEGVYISGYISPALQPRVLDYKLNGRRK